MKVKRFDIGQTAAGCQPRQRTRTLPLIIRARNASSVRVGTPSCRGLLELAAGVGADDQRRLVFSADRAATLCRRAARSPPPPRRGSSSFERAGDDERLARPAGRAPATLGGGCWLAILHAGGGQPSMSARFVRLVEKRADRRRDDRADVGHGLQLPRRGASRIARHRSERARQRPRAAFSPTCRMPMRVTSRASSFCFGSLDLATRLRPTLPSLRGTARSDRGSSGVTTRFSSWSSCRRRGRRSRGPAPASTS